MKIGCPGRDCSLIALPRTRRTPRTVGRYLPEKIGFPDWCVRVCRPYDACKRFGIYYYYYFGQHGAPAATTYHEPRHASEVHEPS